MADTVEMVPGLFARASEGRPQTHKINKLTQLWVHAADGLTMALEKLAQMVSITQTNDTIVCFFELLCVSGVSIGSANDRLTMHARLRSKTTV